MGTNSWLLIEDSWKKSMVRDLFETRAIMQNNYDCGYIHLYSSIYSEARHCRKETQLSPLSRRSYFDKFKKFFHFFWQITLIDLYCSIYLSFLNVSHFQALNVLVWLYGERCSAFYLLNTLTVAYCIDLRDFYLANCLRNTY